MRWLAALLLVCTAAQADVLDGFEDASRWTAVHSDQVTASLRTMDGVQGKALCLDFDFNGVSGYAVARRTLPLDFPANYRFEFKIKGDAPANAFQLKLVDASGENVWWMNRPDYTPPHEWQTMRVKKRQIDFAWGPAADHALRHTEALELVVASGQGGGRGSLCFDELRLEELPTQTVAPPAPTWRDEPQALLIDLGQSREFGGVVLHWREGGEASRYTVQASDDGQAWTTLREVTQGQRRVQPLWLPETEARYLRLNGAGTGHQLDELEIKDLAWGANANAFIEAQAKSAPRGHYPRGFSGEQSYWTLVGVDGGGAHSALMSEDGAVEIDKAGFSIEPFLVTPRGLVSWADARITHSLQEGYLPIPSVQWEAHDVRLGVTSYASGSIDHSQLLTRYTVTNLSAKPQTLTLALAVRPLQVNPPTQFLNTPGGVHTIHDLAWDGRVLAVDGRPRVVPLQRPDAVVASPFDAGSLIEQIAAGTAKPATQLHDESGFASGAMLYALRLPPHGSRSVEVAAALTGAPQVPAQQATVAAAWRAKLNRVGLRVPATGRLMVNSVRSALAHILMSRDGPALQPGTRSYARSWIRDGAMMTEGLLRLGASQPAADFVRWFAPHQFADGKVPCCVDSRGADPVPENDSHGQLIFAIAELYRYTHDRAQLAALWPNIERAVAYMEKLRQSERIPANRAGERKAFWGLMPASISHEGYSAKPMHSYWDDFWALRGYKDAAEMAAVLGHTEAAQRIAAQRDEFQRELHESIAAAVAQHHIAYLPGAAELGDFDATSTTVALSPAGEQGRLPPALVQGTFDRYWDAFVTRRDGQRRWDDYTPYELRVVGSFVRLGQPERAHDALKFFFADQRPAGWNQWAEVVGRELRQPRFVGDMPHAWISSDYLRSVLDMFAYEREADHALVLAAGVPREWLNEGVAISGLATPHGTLNYRLRRVGRALHLDIGAGLTPPAGGLVFHWQGRELHLARVPAHLVVNEK